MIKKIQLPLQTVSLTAAFMIWVLISSLLPYIKSDIAMTANQLAWVTATPVILGSLLRIPIGFLTNRFGSRLLFLSSFLILIIPVLYLSYAKTFYGLIFSGFLLGVGGATFSIGVTSLPKYYPKERHGTVNGIYGVGNLGTAITTLTTPILAKFFGWQVTVRLFLYLLIAFAIINLVLGDRHENKVKASLAQQMKEVYKNEKLWFLSLFYFITFGSFVAFTIYLPNFLVDQFGLSNVDAGMRTTGFIAIATLIRPLGGYLADRWNPYRVLIIIFTGLTISGVLLSFSLSITLFTIGCLTVAACAGIGNGAVFKLVPLYFSKQAGIVNGIVSASGGIGGFFPPLLLTTVFGITGQFAIGFMALSEAALASLIIVFWMLLSERLQFSAKIVNSTSDGVMVTDQEGIIQSVNDAFTKVTGYEKEEAIGKNANILNSGKQDSSFYKKLWETLSTNGKWHGEIINKKKTGDLYREWLSISAIKDDQDTATHFVAIFSDMSDANSYEK